MGDCVHGPINSGCSESFDQKPCSRREFLKIAGVAGAAIGLGAGLGGLVAACGGEAESTTTSQAAATTTSGAATSTTAPATTSTSVATGPETGDEFKIGFVSPLTGALAAFASTDKYCVERWNEAAADGIVCGDGKKHPITIILQDAQSSNDRAAQVAGDLINNSKIGMMLVASTGDMTIPVTDQCEALGTPSFSTDTIWQAWYNGRNADPKVGFKWTYHAFWASDDSQVMYFAMWDQVPNNKVYGALWPNDIDGAIYRKTWPPVLEKRGYTLVDGGDFQPGTEDFTSVISKFKSGGAEICAGLLIPPDFTNFWKQAKQQGYQPKICSVGKALNFPQAVTAMGDISLNLSAPVYWAPSFPFKSSLTGETCQQMADDFETKTKQQWSQSLNHYMLFEVAVDALKRTKVVGDKESLVQALS
ncbi:MAG: ABC transporter substrate-binding protein, partial [Chloroflexi bacterium]|nr:ABC transporter substrate-binding protein [Chloroflexota bacterium]